MTTSPKKEKKPFRLPGINKILRRLIPLVCIGVVINLGFSWYTTDRGKLLDWSEFSGVYLLVAAGLSMLPWFWHALRIAIWSRFFGVKIAPLNLLRIVVATDVGGVVAPVVVGGTPFKMGMLVQEGYQPGRAATLTLLGQFEEAVFFLSFMPVSLILIRPWENPLWRRVGVFIQEHGLWLLLGAGLLFGLVYFLRRAPFSRKFFRGHINRSEHLQMLVADFRHAFRLVYHKGRKPFLLSMLAITGQWLTRFAILITILLALGLDVDYFRIFFLQWMVFVAMLFVPTPGGTGAAEAAFLLVFSALIPRAAIGPAMAGWRLMTYYFMLIVGVVILFGTEKRGAAKRQLQMEMK
ncbi:MAG: flippase-like domain-containing protein [Bacteroidetes bacterium]|nr:MAG: flippase-like domain-containing protein [Bacteroidota bacterium]